MNESGLSGENQPKLVALYEQRPFILTEYESVEDASKDLESKDLEISSKTIRESKWTTLLSISHFIVVLILKFLSSFAHSHLQ